MDPNGHQKLAGKLAPLRSVQMICILPRFELKLLIDMNLSPRWIEALADAGIRSAVGAPAHR